MIIHYSPRSTTFGSVRLALSAGSAQATSAVTSRIKPAVANGAGSRGDWRNSSGSIQGEAASASAAPRVTGRGETESLPDHDAYDVIPSRTERDAYA